MQHMIFAQGVTQGFTTALIIKSNIFNEEKLRQYYVDPYVQAGGDPAKIICLTLDELGAKPTAKELKAAADNIHRACSHLGIKYLWIADGPFFKLLTGKAATRTVGYATPNKIIKDINLEPDTFLCVPQASYSRIMYDDSIPKFIDHSVTTLITHQNNTWKDPANTLLPNAVYNPTVNAQHFIDHIPMLMSKPALAVDIEGFSLRFNEAGIGSISFAWDEDSAYTTLVDYTPYPEGHNHAPYFGYQRRNEPFRDALRAFFKDYTGKLVWHNGYGYDIKVLIYELFMEHPLDTEGMLRGLNAFYWTAENHDTQVMIYLGTNTTSGNKLGLKDNSVEFTGDYAEDVEDIRLLAPSALLKYNATDAASTMHNFLKYETILKEENQESIYEELFRPSMPVLTQTGLVGMSMDEQTIHDTELEMIGVRTKYREVLVDNPYIAEFEIVLQQQAMDKDYQDRLDKAKNPDKIKIKTLQDFSHIKFNPGSSTQVAKLIHDFFHLPVVSYTPTKAPSVGTDNLKTAKALIQAKDPDHPSIPIIEALVELNQVAIILDNFYAAFHKYGLKKEDGMIYLHGAHKLGGTVSGRLSHSNPNMGNLPSSGTIYAKPVKSCFKAPPGWLFVGADSNSLEDMISALTTRDPNKLAVYEKGYDGHCLRAYYYFKDQMPDIKSLDVAVINSIKKKYPEYRQASKVPTFCLTYQGTWSAITQQAGIPPKEAKAIEKAYHEMYAASDKYIADRLKEAEETGYVVGAFGLKLRTPIIHKTFLGHASTPKVAAAEGRTAGNMLGQSYGMLNNRSANAFMQKVWASKYKYDILPVNQIHDASYYLVRNTVGALKFVNDHLIEEMQWQNLPELKHDVVKLGAELSVFYPSWANEIVLPNKISAEEIRNILKQELNK